MKHLAVVVLLVFVGFAGWRAGGVLSADAMSMAVGMIFGVLAGIPAALFFLAATRRSERVQPPGRGHAQPSVASGHPPVVVVAAPAYPGLASPGAQAMPQAQGQQPEPWTWPVQNARPERSFTIVGQEAEWVDEF